ncbi:MAG: FAD:protein FMN transferase, partial [Actinomycetota bacterium]
GCGVLVSLGGDVAASGQAPAGGWRIRVDGSTVAIHDGGLASAAAGAARWQHGGDVLATILRPRHGTLAAAPWRLASVAAASCTDACAAATAAIIKGSDAADWLASLGLSARLASTHGTVRCVAGWPPPGEPATAPHPDVPHPGAPQREGRAAA